MIDRENEPIGTAEREQMWRTSKRNEAVVMSQPPTSQWGDFECHPVGTASELCNLRSLLREVMDHLAHILCPCGKPECLTFRIRQALEGKP